MKNKGLILMVISALVAMTLACAVPAWVNTVESDAEVAVPIAASLIGVIDPPLAPLVMAIQKGFTALVDTLNTYKSSPTATHLQAVQAAFHAVDSNVAQLESAAHIKNPATQATVTAVVQLLAQAVTEISALVPAGAAQAGGSGAGGTTLAISNSRRVAAKGLTAKDLKRQFNQIVRGDPRFHPLP